MAWMKLISARNKKSIDKERKQMTESIGRQAGRQAGSLELNY